MCSFISLFTIAKSIIMKYFFQNIKKKFKKKINETQKPLMEYLFVDIIRLESYISQIKGAVKYDKVPTLAASISATGPQIKFSRSKIPLKWTYHEMIMELLDYLEKSDKMDKERYDPEVLGGSSKPFCHETCIVRKVIIPRKKNKGLTLWISMSPEKSSNKAHPNAGPLYLIESYIGIESEFVQNMSGFSALKYLFLDYGGRIPPSKLWTYDDVSWFSIEPFEYFLKSKAYVSAQHHVKCLYRRRATMMDMNIGRFVTFGYPIFIAESL